MSLDAFALRQTLFARAGTFGLSSLHCTDGRDQKCLLGRSSALITLSPCRGHFLSKVLHLLYRSVAPAQMLQSHFHVTVLCVCARI